MLSPYGRLPLYVQNTCVDCQCRAPLWLAGYPQYFKPHPSYIIDRGDHTIMPQPSNSVSTATTIALILVLFIALFPDLFHLIWTLPLSLLPFSHPSQPPPSTPPLATMSWFQKQFTLPAKSRGSYLITDQVVAALPEIRNYKVGLLNLFVQHTSCALSLNENCT